MGLIDVLWDNEEKTTVRYILHNNWTWKHFADAKIEVDEMIDTVPYIVDTIIDARKANTLPHDWIENPQRLMRTRNPRAGAYVVVGTSKLVQTGYNLVVRAAPMLFKSFRLVPTLDEARVYLTELQTTRGLTNADA
ncbi:MAG: hypothetical protein AAF125_03050 [Chloroflexota bacterium]